MAGHNQKVSMIPEWNNILNNEAILDHGDSNNRVKINEMMDSQAIRSGSVRLSKKVSHWSGWT
jgi:hypothetical protein